MMMKATKTIVKRYKSQAKRLYPYLPILLFASVILLLRGAWLVKHSCIPIATQNIPTLFNDYTDYPAFSRDSKTFMFSDSNTLYLCNTRDDKVLKQWPFNSQQMRILSSAKPDEWILIFKNGSTNTTQIFSTKEGKVIETLGNFEDIYSISYDGRFFLGISSSQNGTKRLLGYKVYDQQTKKQTTLSSRQTSFLRQRFWPNDQTVCLQNTEGPIALYDAITGKPVSLPKALQGRANQIIATRRSKDKQGKEYHAIALRDGTVEYYQGNTFDHPQYVFKVSTPDFIDHLYIFLGNPKYLSVKSIVDYKSKYTQIWDIFSLETGDKIANFSTNPKNIDDMSEGILGYGGHNLIISQHYKKPAIEKWVRSIIINDRYNSETTQLPDSLYNLRTNKQFGFLTLPILTNQGIAMPTVPNAHSGSFSPNGKFFVSVRSAQQYGRDEAAITTWKLPD
jgi:hypothetical protein